MKREKSLFRRILMALSLCLLVSMSALAQIPAGYYDTASGLSGANLKTALHDIIKGHTEYPYSSSNTDVWDILKDADRDPNNANNVLGIYSSFSMDAAAEYASGSGWNREHIWAKSRGDFGTTLGAGTDVHHLRAADISTNSARNNRNFDYATDLYTDGSGNYSGPTLSKTSSTEWTWEPPDAVKGDVARMILYMTTRYEGDAGEPDLELTETLLTNTDQSPVHARMSTILAWHLADPVSAAEQNRNDIVYGYQNNRNPFIDHPEYVCQIFTCAGGGNNAPSYTSSAVTSATEGQIYSYSITTSDSDGDPMTISGTTVPAWLTLTDNGGGSATLTGTPSSGDVGNNAVVLSVTDGTDNSSQTFTINVSPVGGGGSGASDLFISEYIEGSSNNKGLEIANFTGSSIDLSAYSIQKQVNGAGSWGSTLAMSGSLADGDVFVVVNSSSNSAMTAVADLTSGSGYVTFNGNDAIGLFKNGVLIDMLGVFDDASNYAQNVTLVRNSDIGDPNTTYTISEWTSHSTDTFSFLGSHTFDGGPVPDPCDAATGLSAGNITNNSADLSWSSATGANSYNVRYKPTASGTWTNTTSGTSSLSISGLNSSTAYEFQVQTVCTSESAAYSASTNFSTLADPCDTASGLAASNITTDGADLSWSAATGANSYNVRYKATSSSTWTNTTSGTTSLAISGLSSDTAHEFQVQTVCSSNSAAYSSSTNFTTNEIVVLDDLFFSEYVEGSSYNKAVEIANITGADVDLSSYSLKKQTNGAGSWSSELSLSGTLVDQDVYVIAHSSATATVLATADLSTSASFITFNGNDPVGLFKNGVLIDVIGTFDAGSGNFAANETLIRNSGVSNPNTTYTTSEWTFLSSDSFDDLGSHTTSGGTIPVVASGASDLIITEYVEGSSTNKAIELTNLTGASVDLSEYQIKRNPNGGSSWSKTVSLSGTLADGDSYVVVRNNSKTSSALLALADFATTNGAMNFSGNDPIGLFHNGTLVDVVGYYQGGSSNFAKDVTLVRSSSVSNPSTSYDPADWDSYPKNDYSHLGSHTSGGARMANESNIDILTEELSEEFSLNVYPNPSADLVKIDITLLKAEEIQIRIFDLKGQIVYSKIEKLEEAFYKDELDFTALETGLYMLRIQTKSGIEKTAKISIRR